jgi:hypothetical protein
MKLKNAATTILLSISTTSIFALGMSPEEFASRCIQSKDKPGVESDICIGDDILDLGITIAGKNWETGVQIGRIVSVDNKNKRLSIDPDFFYHSGSKAVEMTPRLKMRQKYVSYNSAIGSVYLPSPNDSLYKVVKEYRGIKIFDVISINIKNKDELYSVELVSEGALLLKSLSLKADEIGNLEGKIKKLNEGEIQLYSKSADDKEKVHFLAIKL